ncbi:AAA family ATPase [Methylobacter sp.]|uniref:AAA family ATPase n=1 Tax=Methylobacter sp. TaxID=2051955 RepID=UPI0024871900|nr:AAA family ATPase [Methylobacter sp.]MDI1276931.1 AAA family ATPase [Methylobacter sp.]MDI1359156.1 AAA family ATPase [Methylobacter sp.]
MHIGIFGISGTGKTTLTQVFLQDKLDYFGTSASYLIANAGNDINYKVLNQDKISRNQKALINKYDELKKNHPNTIIELHNVIEVNDGLSLIPPEILLDLNLDLIFFLYTEPDEILKRRFLDKKKSRKIVAQEELKRIQELSLENLISTFGSKNVHVLSGGDPAKQLNNFLDSQPAL